MPIICQLSASPSQHMCMSVPGPLMPSFAALTSYCRIGFVLPYADKLLLECVDPEGVDLPPARGYHTLTAVGNLVVLFGGKNAKGILRKSLRSVFLRGQSRKETSTFYGHTHTLKITLCKTPRKL